MKAANVQGNVEWASKRIEVSHVTHEELWTCPILFNSLPCFGNRDGRKDDSRGAQALLRQMAQEPSATASQFQGASRSSLRS